ncbi:hypothetical protein JW865_00705 [Candidatus Bathyarchaeota archaeon]|nr:hypothetical protein [Candidatus Bathyarchaeota archaeon]
MIIINYFDWQGTKDSLMRWVEAVNRESEHNRVKFIGLYGPSQVRFNWAFIYEAGSQEHYHKIWKDLVIPIEVTHIVTHYFWPETSFQRDLPKYPPAHFFEVR